MWANNRGPHNVPLASLPELSAATAIQLFEHLSEVLIVEHDYTIIERSDERVSNTNGHKFDCAAAWAALQPSGSSVEDCQRRVMLSRLQHGVHPNDIEVECVDETMRVADAAGLDWTREVEIDEVRDRLRMQFETATHNHTVVPNWLPPEWHIKAEEILKSNRRLSIGHNLSGWFIRRQGVVSANEENVTEEEARAEEEPRAEEKADSDNGNGDNGSLLRSFRPIDVQSFPMRQWLYGKHYQRRCVSATVSPGGFGKTSLQVVEALVMTTGLPLLGEQPGERLKVWYHSGEEPIEEIERKILAACQHFEIPQEQLVDWLFLDSGNQTKLSVANGYGELHMHDATIRKIAEALGGCGADVAMLDPLVTLHTVSEQDNMKMNAVVGVFRELATDLNIGIDLSHHTRKRANGTSSDYEAEDARGASAVHDAVRAMRMINHMSEKEAEDLCIPPHERMSYIRVDRGKGNYTPARLAVWRRFVNVVLPNGGSGMPGDEVGVLTPFDYPGAGAPSAARAEAEQIAEQLFLRLLNQFHVNGRNVNDKPNGTHYAPKLFAEEAEAKAARIGKAAFEGAMRRLFSQSKIELEECRDSARRPSTRLTIARSK
jgi:hypothetical protein